jgi:hypothetical protein
MINIKEIVCQLTANAETIRVLVQAVSDGQAQWQPTEETWSIAQVMEHLYNEERIDFRQHLQEMLSDPPQPWGLLGGQYVAVACCHEALGRFLDEREASVAWLQALQSPDWDVQSQISFGPQAETTITLSAGDVLVSWVDHDLAHLRQIIKLLHAWHEQQVAPYSVQYAGGRW